MLSCISILSIRQVLLKAKNASWLANWKIKNYVAPTRCTVPVYVYIQTLGGSSSQHIRSRYSERCLSVPIVWIVPLGSFRQAGGGGSSSTSSSWILWFIEQINITPGPTMARWQVFNIDTILYRQARLQDCRLTRITYFFFAGGLPTPGRIYNGCSNFCDTSLCSSLV